MSNRSWGRTVGLIALCSSMLGGCGRSEADPRVAPPLVRVTTAGAAGDAQRQLTGVVAARVQSDLGFRVDGKVIERLVDAGPPLECSNYIRGAGYA